MNNNIMLEFERTLVGLAGYPFGTATYEKFCKGKVKEDEPIIIVIPDRIERIASSFVQGFFSNWIDKYGVDWVRNNVDISTSKECVRQSVYENLE